MVALMAVIAHATAQDLDEKYAADQDSDCSFSSGKFRNSPYQSHAQCRKQALTVHLRP